MDTPTAPVAPTPTPTQNNHVLMGVLAYISILVIIPYLMAKDSSFVKFHVKQGTVLAIIEIIVWLVTPFLWGLWFIIELIHLALIVLSIIGIVNVVQNKEAELPLVGSFAKSINI